MWLAFLVLITLGPIAAAHRDLRQPDSLGYPEVRMGDPAVPEADARRVADYLARRNPIIDELLPGGAGGTRFFGHLDGNAGMAFIATATIGMSPGDDQNGWPESVELHERAHLVHFYEPALTARLMGRLPAAAPGAYAATSPVEHFAEMAATAWEIVAPPEGFCMDGKPEDRLVEAERRVPGTAGFVSWYVRHPAVAVHDASGRIAEQAAELSRPLRAEWEDLWRPLDARRLSDGRLAPWPAHTLREYLEARRKAARASGLLIDRIVEVALAPSVALLAAIGR